MNQSRPSRRSIALVARAVVEACESRQLFSTVAPAFANQIGLSGVVDYSPTFEDNFDGDSLDKTKWQVRDGYRWRAYRDAPVSTFSYTDETPIQVSNGELALIAHNDPVTGQLKGAYLQTAPHFADVASKESPVPVATQTPGYSGDFEQTYGYWESRAKFSSLPGEWGAFWVMSPRAAEPGDDPIKANRPDVFGNEYDVAEHQALRKGSPSAQDITQTAHGSGYGIYHQTAAFANDTSKLSPTNTLPGEYHVYGMLWTPTAVKFYIDGNLTGATSDPSMLSSVPQMALLSVEVGAGGSRDPGKGSNSSGYTPAEGYGPKETSQARATFDYVRVWNLANAQPIDPTLPAAAEGAVYNDSNADGIRQDAEAGVAGVTLFADVDGNGLFTAGEPSAVTNSAGAYRIDGLPSHARIDLTIVLPTGATVVSPSNGRLRYETNPGRTQLFRDFAIALPAGITPTPTAPATQLAGAAIGTAGSFANGTATIAKALDGSLASYFDAPVANGAWVGLDLGVAGTVASIRFAPRAGWSSRMVGGVFQASNSATFSSGVVTLAKISAKPVEGALTTIAAGDANAYRYVRYLAPNGGWGNVAEVQFFGTPGTPLPTPTPTDPTTPTVPTTPVVPTAPTTPTVPVTPTDPTLPTTPTTPTDPTTPTVPVTPTPAAPVVLTGTTFGTAGSFGNSGNTIAKAFDGSLSNYVDLAVGNGAVIGLDLGSAKTIAQIKFAPRAGWSQRMVGGRFEGSNVADFSGGATTLYTIGAKPTEGALTTVVPLSAAAFRYVRYVAPNGSYGNVAELQFLGAADATTPTTPVTPTDPTTPTVPSVPTTPTVPTVPTVPTTPIAGGTLLTGTAIGTAGSFGNSGNTGAKALDGSLSSFFDSQIANGAWVGLDLGAATTLSQIKYAPRAGWSSRMVGGLFQASNTADFTGDVVTLTTVTAKPAEGVLTSVAVSDPAAYRYVRYVAPKGGYGNVAEVQWFA